MSLFRLDNKVAVVTGAAGGLGAATTAMMVQQGARVAAVDIDADGLEALAGESDGAIVAYPADVSKVSEIQKLVGRVTKDMSGIDILVNNAAICPRLPFADSTEADWEKLFSINAKSQYFFCQAVCPGMKGRGGGRIINMCSTGGRVGGFANSSIYSGTKGAIAMFTKSIAREVAADGVLVNAVAPGVIDTGLMRNLSEDKVKALCAQVPLGRLGRPEEVAAMVVFIASDACSYCTGAMFDINGGWVML